MMIIAINNMQYISLVDENRFGSKADRGKGLRGSWWHFPSFKWPIQIDVSVSQTTSV